MPVIINLHEETRQQGLLWGKEEELLHLSYNTIFDLDIKGGLFSYNIFFYP